MGVLFFAHVFGGLRSMPESPSYDLSDYPIPAISLINNVKIGIFRSTTGPGRFLFANPAMLQIFGYGSFAEFKKIEVIDLYISPSDRNAVLEEVMTGGSIRNRELPMKKMDGTPIWCSVTITAEYGDDRHIKWLDGVIEEVTSRKRMQEEQLGAIAELETRVRDRISDLVNNNALLMMEITERKRVEEKLREQKQFLEVLLDTIPSPVFYKDICGVYQGCNEAFEKYMGRRKEEVVGKTDYDLAPRELADKYSSMDHTLFESPDIRDFETSFTDAEGVRHDVIIIKAPYFKSDGNVGGIIGVMMDVTDRRKYEEERLKIDKLESLGVLAGGIAHDFNNIITGIMGNISLARMFIDTTHKAAKSLLAAEKASQRAAGLAHQLLTFAKGGVPIKKAIKLQEILKESVSFIMRGVNVQEVLEVPDSLHTVNADEGQISQAFGNIVLNGVQSMPDGGVLKIGGFNVFLGKKNHLGLPEGNYVRIDFEDQGCGIPAENLKKVFDPYFTTKEKGTGLGLSSAFSIMVRHGGYIDLHSILNIGTTFSCYLPACGDSVPAVEMESDTLITNPAVGGAVLVMDDDEMIREITSEILEYLGYNATLCARGEEVIELYRQAREAGHPFFAVIMDLTIPGGMGGKEAAQNILALDPEASLIVSSGYSNDPVLANYEEYGFCGVVIKPYQAIELYNVMDKIKRCHLTK
jgi:PAS domain S-box-containing protein